MYYPKTSLLTFLLLCITQLLTAQTLQFTAATDLPDARSAVASAYDGQFSYVVNGFGPGVPYATEVYRYEDFTDSWSVLTDATRPKRFGSAAVVGDFLYIFNGQVDGGTLNTSVEKVSLADGSIELLNDNPQPARAAGVATWNDKIYSFGGTLAPNQYSDQLYEYDPAADTWTALTTIPFGSETKGAIIDGKLYVIGGFNGSVSDRIDAYDIATDTWESTFTMPVGISAHAVAAVDNTLFIVGDFSDLDLLAAYVPALGSFELLDSNLEDRRHCAAVGSGGALLVFGGNTTSMIDSSISSVQRAQILTSTRELATAKPITISPNPVAERLQLDRQYDWVAVYDAQGRVVLRAQQADAIDVTELASGTYSLRAQVGTQLYRARFVRR